MGKSLHRIPVRELGEGLFSGDFERVKFGLLFLGTK
jgi:hypothetical protein